MEAFENRLRKVNRHIRKWAARNGISCYRIYDQDIPEFPFCIERYESYLHISVYARRHFAAPGGEDAPDIEVIRSLVSRVLEVPPDHIFFKLRKRFHRRSEQYEKQAAAGVTCVVREQGLQFKVNLSDYLDTGLFLDHRPLRQRFRGLAGGKNVLNLFAYTGSFSVYAAAGAARGITTVDLSANYLNRAKENLEINGLYDPAKHHFVASDCMDFLKQFKGEPFDLAIVDPPAFSNSKKMKGTWDTQRDHPAMLHLLSQHMQAGGTIFFSNNLTGFKPAFERLHAAAYIKDITASTIPEDFRNKQIHHCYEIGIRKS